MNAATIGIDPRIRARRVAVLRAEGRHRLRVIAIVATVAALAAAAWTVSRSSILDLDSVRVQGVDGPAAELIRDIAGVAEGVALIDVDTDGVELRLERLPWVKQADVQRKWPGTLVVTVVERTAVAVVPSGTGLALLDEDGVVMARESLPTASTVAGLPVIAVPLSVAIGDVHLDAGPGLAVVQALTVDLAPWVEAIMVGDGRVGLDLVGGARVSMGPAVRLDDKVTALRAILAGVDLTCIVSIDVTAADQTTVRRDAVCDVAARASVSDA